MRSRWSVVGGRWSACGVWLLLCGVLGLPMVGAQSWEPALPGYRYEFPRDHFSHPSYATEWWYYTGNLRAADGHRFGFELTFFRQGVSRAAKETVWDVADVWMAHLALSDVSGKRYEFVERLNRAGPGLAGVDAARGLVWNGNWKTRIGPSVHHLEGVAEDFSFSLDARPEKVPVIQGLDGVSQKAAGTGHASHYVSFTRMATTGTIALHGQRFQVEGDAWMDHEFFSETAGGDEVGWDWLSVELDNRTELMLYRLRHADGRVDPFSSGTYIDASGKTLHLPLGSLIMTADGERWKSAKTGANYPVGWTVKIPELGLDLRVTTPLKAQEFVSRFGPSYWEGAIDITGQRAGHAVHGTGYLEMTGYAGVGKGVLPTAE